MPPYPPEDLVKAVLLQQYFEVLNRLAEGFVELFKEKLGIEKDFPYKILERAYNYPYVAMILMKVFEMSQGPVKDDESNFSPDGTGPPTSIKGNWENNKENRDNGKSFMKMIAILETRYQLISAVRFPDSSYV